MLTIRLSRVGKKNKPMYRLIISEKARDPYGRALEILGSYNPYTKEFVVKAERINYWISQGAGTSNTVNNLLVEKGIIKGDKMKATKINTKKAKNKEQEAKDKGQEAKNKEQEAKNKEQKEETKPAEEIKPVGEVKTEEATPTEKKKEA